MATLVALVAGLVVAASASAGSVETQYVAQLRVVSAQAVAAAAELDGLARSDTAELKAAGQELLAAAGAATDMLRTYRDAKTRFGTQEEFRGVTLMAATLDSARATYARLVGDPNKVKRRERSVAEKQLRALVTTKLAGRVAATEVGRWLGEEAVSDLLAAKGLRQVRSTVQRAVAAKVRAQANALVKRTLKVGLDLGAPLGPQLARLRAELRNRAREAAVQWLARVVLNTSPSGLVVRLVGRPLVRFLERQLKEAFRGKGNLKARTARTLAGLAKHHTILENSPDDERLGVLKRRVARAENALTATKFLERDLARAARARRCNSNDAAVRASCEAARGFQQQLAAAKSGPPGLETWIIATRARFLLDSKLAKADFNAAIEELKRMQRQLRRLIKTLKNRNDGTTVGVCANPWAGDWLRNEHAGTMTVAQTGGVITKFSWEWFGGSGDFFELEQNGNFLKGRANRPSDNVKSNFEITVEADGKSFGGNWRWDTTTTPAWNGSFSGRRDGGYSC